MTGHALTVKLGGVGLKSPLMLGSGSLGDSAKTLRPFQRASVGAVVTRTIRGRAHEERRTFPSPHLYLDSAGRYALNCEWGSRAGVDYWSRDGLPTAASRGPVVVSVSGRDIDDCAEVCGALPLERATFLELNVSCSHAGELYGRIGEDAEHVFRLVRTVREVSPHPPIVKLSPSPELAEVAAAAEQAGALAITACNTLGPGLDIDVETGRPVLGLGGGFGGVSGPAIFPFALRAVDVIRRAVKLPIIGVGGIASYRDVIKMLMVGATAVQVYTRALWHGPELFDRISAELIEYLHRHDLASVSELSGRSRAFLAADTQLTPAIPVVDVDRCRPCPRCSMVCPVEAISVNSHAEIDPELCVGCGACVDACPPVRGAISSEWRRPPRG